ncbi:hypothetical protein CDAR_517351 [Caerostris darwini]|uniref:Uncharacterized protein n=1 Tax=Caerostris darwini TaxID=1538125 RepID=A0AAV4SMV4_9ARAC|nr:hypothetical protein CDAR_517351 [Caerostris darwini]
MQPMPMSIINPSSNSTSRVGTMTNANNQKRNIPCPCHVDKATKQEVFSQDLPSVNRIRRIMLDGALGSSAQIAADFVR